MKSIPPANLVSSGAMADPAVTDRSAPPKNEDVAATTGRGFLVITGAKLWFMVGGFLISFGLPLIFDAPTYGDYGDLNNILSILSMVMITGVLQPVSRFVAADPERCGGVLRQALRLMLPVSLLVSGGFVLLAPWLAAERLSPDLVLAYRLAGVILFFYGLYSVFIGVLNGRKRFLPQAMFDMGFTTLKALFVVGFAAIGWGVQGAFGGFALAAAVIMALAALSVRREVSPGPPAPGFVPFALQVMLYTFVANLVFKLDMVLLQPAAEAVFGRLGVADVPEAVRLAKGQYTLAVQVARVPWQVTLAITFVIFPLVSQSTFAQDKERTLLYIRQTLRYGMILVGAAAVVLTAVPRAPFAIFKPEYAPAAEALAWLAPAYFLFAVWNIVNTILTSAGRSKTVLAIGLVSVGVVTLLYWQVLPRAGDGIALLDLTGITTLAAFALGLALGLGTLWKLYGPPIPFGTAARVLGIGGALVVAGHLLPPMGKIASLAVAVAVGLAFLVGLVLTREFGPEDRARLEKVLKRRRA